MWNSQVLEINKFIGVSYGIFVAIVLAIVLFVLIINFLYNKYVESKMHSMADEWNNRKVKK
jgi:uncharacterized membrane protein